MSKIRDTRKVLVSRTIKHCRRPKNLVNVCFALNIKEFGHAVRVLRPSMSKQQTRQKVSALTTFTDYE
ncbi:MAG: hypothetical protein VX430_10120 [Pseudomonadota bacterium]|nr:hypothetical protein [Pseudomonadota bacterium]